MSLNLKKTADILDACLQPKLAAEWDNVGLLVGESEQPIKNILLALDITSQVIEEAKTVGAQLILTHHPLIFHPVTSLAAGAYPAIQIKELIRSGIACYAAHTNLDILPGGVNHTLALALGLVSIEGISINGIDNQICVGSLTKPTTLKELACHAKQVLQVLVVKLVCVPGPITQVAVCGGAGSGFWPQAKAAGAQCLISAEGKHEIGLAAQEAGFSLIDVGHYASEHLIISVLAQKLQPFFEPYDIKIIQSKTNTDPWQFI